MRLPQLNDSSRKIFDAQGCGAEKNFSKGPAIKSYSHKMFPQESSDRGRLGGCRKTAPLIRSDDFRAEPRRFSGEEVQLGFWYASSVLVESHTISIIVALNHGEFNSHIYSLFHRQSCPLSAHCNGFYFYFQQMKMCDSPGGPSRHRFMNNFSFIFTIINTETEAVSSFSSFFFSVKVFDLGGNFVVLSGKNTQSS